ncbi:SMI1/KNR4 family protein [Mucilaginibacter aquariorum]|uniref:SMI1/KNR4 family protein n=1 Tax=Mucilaginibacter aquariorum TaxID=2967225 RepID=A0ABT1T4B9_9SPHI|nr:SMI1/KNR4 family protein [Mucilaginibacter aquariorum]MCQ6959456.1 SMI1/KNR4 family protein [Mucilaginibacter aquariorum]
MTIDEQLIKFETDHNLIIPGDLKEYFRSSNIKSLNDYSDFLFEFYGIDEFKSVKDEVGDYGGIPDYRNIVNVLPQHENCFVFAEYMIHSGVYAIRLFKDRADKNEVYAIIGSEYKQVADSFTEFIILYKDRGESIYF